MLLSQVPPERPGRGSGCGTQPDHSSGHTFSQVWSKSFRALGRTGVRVELEDIPWSLCKQLLNGGLVQGQHLEVWPALVLPGNYCHTLTFPRVACWPAHRGWASTCFWCRLKALGSSLVHRPPPGRPETQTESSDSESPREALVRLWLSAPHLPTERTRQVAAAVSLRCH